MSRPGAGYRHALRVDRDKVTPSLLRVFVSHGSHHDDSQFTPLSQPTKDEYQLYAWRDTTVRELLLLLRDTAPTLRTSPLARYSLKLLYYDPQLARFTSRELAHLAARDLLPSAQGNRAGERTLDDVRFVVGDFVDVCYVAGPVGMGGGAPREGWGAGGGTAPPAGPGGPGGGGARYGPPPHLHSNSNPRFGGGGSAPLLPPLGPRGGGGGAPSGPRAGGGPTSAREAWGPAPGGGGGGMERRREGGGGAPPVGAGGGWGARGGGVMDDRRGGGGGPADNGWGRRGGGDAGAREDRPPPRRRDSRSRSPVRRARSRSPPPPPRG